MSFQDILDKVDIKFIDRNDITDFVKTEYYHMISEKGYYKIFSVYGMGGMGKSRLLMELKSVLEKTFSADCDLEVFYLSLEIVNSDNYLNALIKLREQIKCACPLFDYSLLSYWRYSQITKLDESFLKTVKRQWFDIAKDLGSMVSYPLSQFLSLPIDTCMSIMEKGVYACKMKYYESYFNEKIKDISTFTENELRECLGAFLGMELNRLYHKKHLFVMIDAYEQYQSSEFVDWLDDLIEQSATGLFIISSREQIKVSSRIKKYFYSKELGPLPKTLVSELLKNSIPVIDDSTINHIINVTECVPIYLSLAIKTYHNLCKNHLPFDEITFFMYKSKDELILKFFNHLKPGEQEFMLALSFVQIFDQNIFEMLLSIVPSTSILAFNEIRSLSLVSNITNDSSFYKVHNVINTNVNKIIDYDTRYYIFRKYLNHIASKTIPLASDIQKIILYKHILLMVMKNEFILKKDEMELLLDIFFQLKQTLRIVLPNGIDGLENYMPLKNFYHFTRAVSDERQDTLIRLKWLEQIDFGKNDFGKHNKSLRIINGYLRQWNGDDKILIRYLSEAYPALQKKEIREWYYAQTVIFWADHLTITGKFRSAEKALNQFYNDIKDYSDQENSIFQTARHLGHVYRFNFSTRMANKMYLSTRTKDNQFANHIQKIYIYTNLCETNCYLQPLKVNQYCYSGLRLAKTLNDSKSLAKIYYSMAIASIHAQKYKRARKYINKSMYYDKKDGYELGLLFPMLANLFLRYSVGKPLETMAFEHLLKRVQVYGFLRLALAVMNNDRKQIKQIQSQYEWLNFKETVKILRKFLTIIRHG